MERNDQTNTLINPSLQRTILSKPTQYFENSRKKLRNHVVFENLMKNNFVSAKNTDINQEIYGQ